MNEQQAEFQPPVELPMPQQEQVNNLAEQGGVDGAASELAQNKSVEQGQPVPLQPVLGSQMPAIGPATQGQAGTATSYDDEQGAAQTPLIADDVDLIEKEWVHKAKQIVEQTKDNPYARNKQMNEVKADYLKKRYNKDLKIAED